LRPYDPGLLRTGHPTLSSFRAMAAVMRLHAN
jgi:hypothetical protein